MQIDDNRPPLLVQLDAEQSAITAGASACNASCACHGGIVCLRTEHPHDSDDAQPHLGYADGQLIQWVHTAPAGV